VAGFVLWERESEQQGKEVKNSEAHTCSSHGIALFGSGDSGHG
jgi:hypothetical protein